MEVPLNLRDIFSEERNPKGVTLWMVANGTIDQNVAIVSYALKQLTEFSYDLVSDLNTIPEGHLYEETVGYALCRKGVKSSEDWDDHEYDGYRFFMYDFFFEGGWEKTFSDGHTETLLWGYLTQENASDVIDLISFWPDMAEVVEFLLERFSVPKH
jgi:hypothetical protein